LAAADAHSRYGDFARADGHLAAADGKTQRTAWLRTAAEMALHRGDLAAALSLRREVVATEPLDVEGHRSVAELIAATESRAAAVAFLRESAVRFPHHYRLNQLWIEWLREEDPAVWEAALRHLLEINPVDA